MSSSAQTLDTNLLVEAFEYRPAASKKSPIRITSGRSGIAVAGAAGRDEIDARLEAARQEGIAEGRRQAAEELETASQAKIAELRESVVAGIRDFDRDKKSYFKKMETEVVGLALAIARKILNREAAVDPLLLAGAVKVALERVSDLSTLTLRVQPEHAEAWRAHLAKRGDALSQSTVVADPALAHGGCVLSTSAGDTDLTVESQLRQIERGFLDLFSDAIGE